MDCTLILTEGDSAMALAVAGLEVVGRQVRRIVCADVIVNDVELR